MRAKLCVFALCLGVIITFIGCKQEEDKGSYEQSYRAKETPTPRVYPEEIYGDPKIFDSPRIQFTWRSYKEDERRIWSIKLDGSDLRRVLPNELLFKNGHSISAKPVRSPDNRYLVVSMFSDGPILKELFDLKTKTVKTIATGGFQPNFQWTPDSKKIIFVLDGYMMEYNLDTGKLKYRKAIFSHGFYLTKDGKRFYAVKSKGFDIYNFNGGLIKSVEFTDGIVHMHHSVSADGKYMLYYRLHKSYIVKTEDPREPIFVDEDRWHFTDSVFSPDNKYFYYGPGTIKKVNIATKAKETIFEADSGYSVSDLTMINVK
jgi:WD40 repeat protein